jgi:hypothetical protein
MPVTFLQARLIIIAPLNRVTPVVTWLQANIRPNCVPDDLGPGLSATGIAPVTHRWCNSAFTDQECKEILIRLCQLASVSPPTNNQWNNWTKLEKRTWLASVRAAIFAGFGVWVTLADNEGQWDSPSELLTARGLQPVTGGV